MRYFSSMRAAFAALLVVAAASPAADSETGFVPMFNGKDLTGWDGKPGWWKVENGALTAESTPEKPCTECNYIIWRGGKPGDFEMRAEYRLFGSAANSGIQFRSRELPNYDTSGYQADMENGDQWTGCLFEHTRGGVAMRGEDVLISQEGRKRISFLPDSDKLLKKSDQQRRLQTPPAGANRSAELLGHIKKDDWNSYRIVARGSEITLEINGVVMTHVIDNQAGKAAKDGIIALQMHPGPPMKVQFRNLRIKIFDAPK